MPATAIDLQRFVDDVAAELDAGPSVFVAFSAAGPRAFAVAEASQPTAIVFLDARLPADGVAPDSEPAFADLLDALPIDVDGNLPPWAEWWPEEVLTSLCPDPSMRADLVAGCPAVPRASFSVPIPAPPFNGSCGYVQLSDGYADQRDLAAQRGWPTATVVGGTHLSPFVQPESVAPAVLDVIERLT